jgi:hypothetical protein
LRGPIQTSRKTAQSSGRDKSSKKNFDNSMRHRRRHTHGNQSFFASFCSQKEVLTCLVALSYIPAMAVPQKRLKYAGQKQSHQREF